VLYEGGEEALNYRNTWPSFQAQYQQRINTEYDKEYNTHLDVIILTTL